MRSGRAQQLRWLACFGSFGAGPRRAVVSRMLCFLLAGIVGMHILPGCRHGWLGLEGGTGTDPLALYDGVEGYALLETAEMRAVVRSDTDATLLLSTQGQAAPMVMEQPGRSVYRTADRSADRLLTGLSGPVELVPGDWQILVATADRHQIQRDVRLQGGGRGAQFSLSIQREIRLLGRRALSGFLAGAVAADVQVSGYESRTFFTNPGPLPWPSGTGLPYIRIESDFWRSADVVWFFHIDAGEPDVLARQSGLRYVMHASALVGVYQEPSDARVVVPLDTVLPRMALLDRQRGLLTLIAYTPAMGLSATRDTGVLRPDPEIVLSQVEGGQRWFRIATSGAAFPLATGGSNRHHRQTFHVRGALDDLVQVGAAFCRLPLDDVHDLLAALDEVAE